MPECWGHRGASAAYPENTLASFEAAINDGAEGIESDVHVSLDGVLLMFHDPNLERTTGTKALIREKNWYGTDGMEHIRTIKEPKQAIPTFTETLDLLMKPANQHVKFDIDVKVFNDADRLFSVMNKIITSYPEWETKLMPRIILGLWHPRFVKAAKTHVPYFKRSHIGFAPDIARKYFWNECEAFSMWFPCLTTADGEKFRRECKKAGKQLMVWTVNNPAEMMEAVRWGVDTIITDVTKTWLDMRAALNGDYDKVCARHKRSFLWAWPSYYSAVQYGVVLVTTRRIEKAAGTFDSVESMDTQPTMVRVRV